MKKTILFASTIILFILTLFSSCKKKNDACETANTNGRIIGYDPCRRYDKVPLKDAGFVIEIDNGTTKDTTVKYGMPENLFVFQPSYIDGSYSSYLFRPEVQDKFKIKFKYKYAADNEKTTVICDGMVNTAHFDAAVKGTEVFLSCISVR